MRTNMQIDASIPMCRLTFRHEVIDPIKSTVKLRNSNNILCKEQDNNRQSLRRSVHRFSGDAVCIGESVALAAQFIENQLLHLHADAQLLHSTQFGHERLQAKQKVIVIVHAAFAERFECFVGAGGVGDVDAIRGAGAFDGLRMDAGSTAPLLRLVGGHNRGRIGSSSFAMCEFGVAGARFLFNIARILLCFGEFFAAT